MTSSGSAKAAPALALLDPASHRVTRTVDAFHGDDLQSPSLLPGWTRAHVVAHLALNAEAMTRAVHDRLAGQPAYMYDSDDRRAQDIEALAREHHFEIRDRLLGATTVLHEAFATVPDGVWDEPVERTPGGRALRVSSLPGMRVRELEIHHVDLGSSYTTADWSPGFSALLLDAMTRTLQPSERLVLRPLDLDRTWTVDASDSPDTEDAAVVTGPAADLGWWLTGRPAPETLSSTRGQLPEIGAW